MKTYEEFCEALRQRESSGNYQCINQFGYLGAYQFGLARLTDLGFAVRKDPDSSTLSYANEAFTLIPPLSEDAFLNSPILQDCVFYLHVQNLKKQIIRRFENQNIALSGCIAAAHLLGMGGIIKYLQTGEDEQDGIGTHCSEYYRLFTGYNIP